MPQVVHHPSLPIVVARCDMRPTATNGECWTARPVLQQQSVKTCII